MVCQRLHFVVKNGFDCPRRAAGKPLQKLLNAGSITEIFEEGGTRVHACLETARLR